MVCIGQRGWKGIHAIAGRQGEALSTFIPTILGLLSRKLCQESLKLYLYMSTWCDAKVHSSLIFNILRMKIYIRWCKN
jgi:hypothetical protein